MSAHDMKNSKDVCMRVYKKEWMDSRMCERLISVVDGVAPINESQVYKILGFFQDDKDYYVIEEIQKQNDINLLDMTYHCVGEKNIDKIADCMLSIFSFFERFSSEHKRYQVTSHFIQPANFVFEGGDSNKLKVRFIDFVFSLESHDLTPPSLPHVSLFSFSHISLHPKVY